MYGAGWMWKADTPDTACSRAGTWLSPPSCRGRAGPVQPGERSHHVLPTSCPCLRSPNQVAIGLLMASLQGLGLGRRLQGWDVPAGCVCLVSKHSWQLKLCSRYGRGSESWSFDGGPGSGQVGLALPGSWLQPPASSLLLPVGSLAGPRHVQLLIDPHPHPSVRAEMHPAQNLTHRKTERQLFSGTKEGAGKSSCRRRRAWTLR